MTRGDVLSLDGTDDVMQITGLMGSPADITLAAWVNLDSGAGVGEIISLGDHVTIRADDTTRGVMAFFYDGGSWNTIFSDTYIAGTGWHHVAYTFDDTSNTQTLYLDGVVAAIGNITASISYSGLGSDTFIGRHGDGGATWFLDGKVDDARIISRALSAAEIESLVAAPTQPADVDTVAITVTAAIETTLTKRVAAGSDDAEEEGPTGTTPNRIVA